MFLHRIAWGVLLTATLCVAVAAEEVKPVKYVFLFIGDGMSIPQRMMADEFLQRTTDRKLRINQFPAQAVTITRSANAFITDSAASGTAIACGEKTKNGRIGMNTDGKRQLESVAAVAHRNQRKVGIVTSVTLNHATPAAFYGHRPNRGQYYELGQDLVNSGFDYFGGGGIAANDDRKNRAYTGDIYELAAKAGYTVTRDRAGFAKLNAKSGKTLAVGAPGALPYAIDRVPGDLTLADFTAKGIELLDNPKGFFMMVEGGKIDWMCHANDAATVLREMIDFDDAVAVALDFAAKHPEDTLIVVTGDHETGGLTLGFAGTGYNSYIERLASQRCSSDTFMDKVKTLLKNTPEPTFDAVKPLITECFGMTFGTDAKDPMTVSAAEEARLREAFAVQLKAFRAGKNSTALPIAVLHTFDNKAGLGWTTGAHTALPVNTTATGKSAGAFKGMIDNTEIAKILKETVR